MKITLINGSPKRRDSASGVILSQLKGYMKSDASLCELHFFTPHPQPEQLQEAADSDVLIFAFPLYVDGIPSHMVSALLDLETVIREKKKKRTVYAILNCGFYEGCQNAVAIRMMENWCCRSGLEWGYGIGAGGGGMVSALANVPAGRGPGASLGKALCRLAEDSAAQRAGETVFLQMDFPRFAYKAAAEMGWRQAVKKNGMKTKEILKQWW